MGMRLFGVFIGEKVWLENSLSQLGGGGCPSRETGCGWQGLQVEASSTGVLISP